MPERNILYLSYDGLTDPLGQSQILPYLRGLSRAGYQITLISFEKPSRYAVAREFNEAQCELFGITWDPLPYHKHPPIFSTLYDLFCLRRRIVFWTRKREFSVVHCRSYITALMGLWMKNSYGTKFLFDMRGFWPDERVEGGLWKLNNPFYNAIYNYFKRKEKDLLAGADGIITLTENAKRELVSWNVPMSPIAVIPTCVDLELFNPASHSLLQTQEKRTSLGISTTDFVVVYLGSWGTWYQTEDILNFFSALKRRRTDAKLLIISHDHPVLVNYEFGADCIVLPAARSEVPLLLTIADVCVCFIMPTYSKIASSATKMAEAWAMNLPVVTNTGWGDIDILVEKGFPIIVCNGQEGLEGAIKKLLEPVDNHLIRSKIEFFDLRSGISRLEEIYQRLSA